VAHHHVQGLYGVVGDLTGAPLQGLLQRKQGHLRTSVTCKTIALSIKLGWVDPDPDPGPDLPIYHEKKNAIRPLSSGSFKFFLKLSS
jgi:hypothetical protein